MIFVHNKTNRSWRLDGEGSIDHLKQSEEEIVSPDRGEVVVRVHATSLNYRDYAILHGGYPGEKKENLVQLSDGAGEVIETGEDVTRVKEGDRVAGNFMREWFGREAPAALEPYGTHSDGWLTYYKTINAELLVHIPDHLTFEQAATLPCAALTAWNSLQGPVPLKAGDTALTLGSGGVSVFATQFARLLGIRTIGTSSSDKKAETLKDLGASHIINYKEHENWGEKVKEQTGGRGVDRVVEVGGPATIKQSLASLRTGGEASLIGVLSTEGDDISYFDLFGRANTRTIMVGSRDEFEQMNRAIENSGLEPVIDRVFSFDEAKDAYRHLEGQNFIGKIVIRHD
jgi:NADPH:quinone reductase-like Zn-dependent oxidoreductase